MKRSDKTLHANRRPAPDFGPSIGFFDPHGYRQVTVQAEFGQLGRSA